MSGTSGSGGSITFANLTVGVKSWTLDQEVNILESTDFDSSGNREYISGLKGFSGSCDVNWSSTNTVAVGDSGNITLQYTGGQSVTGAVIVSSIGMTTNVDGINEMSLSYQGTGALPS